MKWIKRCVVVILSAAASVLFALSSQQVEVDSASAWTIAPNGSLYLLREDAVLQKLSSQGKLEWAVTLPAENEEGTALR